MRSRRQPAAFRAGASSPMKRAFLLGRRLKAAAPWRLLQAAPGAFSKEAMSSSVASSRFFRTDLLCFIMGSSAAATARRLNSLVRLLWISCAQATWVGPLLANPLSPPRLSRSPKWPPSSSSSTLTAAIALTRFFLCWSIRFCFNSRIDSRIVFHSSSFWLSSTLSASACPALLARCSLGLWGGLALADCGLLGGLGLEAWSGALLGRGRLKRSRERAKALMSLNICTRSSAAVCQGACPWRLGFRLALRAL
mmetsp:Transcript_105121/g.297598  ORF Transcript_105121/g.297598 Transcript_105121/m.297598 type:complete len:252 (-) Transcript_105121:979-1734(-)